MKRIIAAIAAVLLILTGIVMASPATATTANGVPVWDHVVIVVMENHSTTQIMGSSNAPYINSLASQGTNFTDAHGIVHPSEPNYIALFSGSKQGLTDDSCPHTYTTTNNMEEQLQVAGKTFKGYAESMPSAGYTGCTSGDYARRHAPWVNFTSVDQATQSLPFSSFPTDYTTLPTVSMVIPNNQNNMHDGTINAGDTWLQTNLDGYAQWAKTHNSLLIVTFDEDDNSVDNHIPTVMVGANVKVGNTFSSRIDLYDLLTLVQDAYGLPRVNNTVGRAVMTQPWGSSGTTTTLPSVVPIMLIPQGNGLYQCKVDYPQMNSDCEITDAGSAENVVRIYPSSTTPGNMDCSITFTGRSTRPCFLTTHG